MNTEVTTNFAVKPLVAAVALAISAVNAYAAPTPNQMPGAGIVTAVSTGATVNAGGVGTTFINLPTPTILTLAGGAAKAVIQWGGAGAPTDTVNPAGFNIGSSGKLTFTSAVAGSAVLNIDGSGNPSQIFGQLDATGGATAPAIFVSNANGIIVSGGRIAAPNGIGLIGANLNNATAINDFTANNAASVTGCTTTGCLSGSFLDVASIPSTGNINNSGAINGSLTLNAPAKYILMVGNDVTNTGNLYAGHVDVAAGIRAIEAKAGVNDTVVGGLPPVAAPFTRPVHRLWDVDAGFSLVNGNLGTLSGNVEIAKAGSNFVNTGSISANGGFIGAEASGSIRSGTAADTNLLIGLFADAGVVLSTFSDTSKIELYNVVTGYTTGVTMPFLDINQQTKAAGDVTINALTRGSQPSSITTTGDVRIKGGNIKIDSTINHEVYTLFDADGDVITPYGAAYGRDLIINGTKSVSITKDVGARRDVIVTSKGPLTISGNINSNTDRYGYYGGQGGIYITNTGENAATSITGNLTARAGAYWWSGYAFGSQVSVNVKGPLTISGAVTAESNSVNITNTLEHAPTVISGPVFGGEGNVNINVIGPLTISGDVTASRSNVFGYCCTGGNININNYATSGTTGDATTISGALYADRDVHVDVWGPLTMSGAVTALDDVRIHNFGGKSGNTTTITGDVYGYDYVDIRNYGSVNSHLNISGMVSAHNGGLHIVSYGDLQLGAVNSGSYIDIGVYGLHSELNGPVHAGFEWTLATADDPAAGVEGFGNVFYQAPIAQTNVKPAAVITGDTVTLEVRNFQGVNAAGLPYLTAAQNPGTAVGGAQIFTDNLELYATGSVNAPITGNTNFLKNAMVIAPRSGPDGFINASISATGASFQAINLLFKGDEVWVDSGNTVTPFQFVGLTSGTFPAGGLQGNQGSSMLLQAERNMQTFGNGGIPDPMLVNGDIFQFPGGVVFKAGESLTVNNPVYNAWTFTPAAYQGVFLEAPIINALSYFATNKNSWVNFSTLPTGAPSSGPILSVYTITQLPSLISFNFVIDPLAPHINTFSKEIGPPPGPVNTCPIGAAKPTPGC